MKRVLAALLLAPIRLYQRLLSPLLPARCKYHPSCSQYAVEAIRTVGPGRGMLLAAWRLARCNPWSNGGVDEIEDRPFFRDAGRAAAAKRGRRPEATA